MKKVRSLIRRATLMVPAVALGLYGFAAAPLHPVYAACSAPSMDYGSASQTVNISAAATYTVWSHLMAPDATNNSYLLEVDGTCYTVGDAAIPANAWTWVNYKDGNTSSPVSINLSAGSHTLKMIGREPNVELDRVLFMSDQTCTPTGTGDNCTTAVDVTPQAVTVTAPAANATVSGAVNVTASATDDTKIAKVEFYVGTALKATSTTAPYSFSWDSTTVADGTYSIQAKAYDTANNTATDSIQVKAANTDTSAPSAPTNLSAKASAYNKVDLTWTKSTDNAGVTAYRILRNNVAVTQVGNVSAYSDTTALPNTAYTYQVFALDAAGNVSPGSNQATVTTPSTPDSQAPTTPAGLSATAVSASQINVAWSASTDNVGVAGYDVYRSTGTNTASKVATVATTSYGDTNLSASTTYTYYVVARDAAGNSSQPSATVTTTTLAKQSNKGKGGVHGHVTTTSGQTLTDATIRVSYGGVKHIYTTDSSGSYSVSDVPIGTRTFKYVSHGYVAQRYGIGIRDGVSVTKNVKLNAR